MNEKKIVGYSDVLSVRPKDKISFMVSCDPKIKFISSAYKASNENNKLITDKNQSLSKKLIQYEEEIKNITKKYEISKNKDNETNLIDKLNQKELNKSLSLYNGLKIIKSKNITIYV